MVVRVNLALGPRGRVEGGLRQWPESGTFDLLEDFDRSLSSRSVDALPCDRETPAVRLTLNVVAVDPLLASEEALANVLDGALDHRLAGRVTSDRGIDHKAAIVGVLGEDTLEDRIVSVGLRHGGLEVVDHHSSRDAPKEDPCGLETADQVFQTLRWTDVDVLVAAVDQRDDESVVNSGLPASGVVDQTESTEVDFGDFTRSHLGAANRHAMRPAEVAVLHGEPVERAVGHSDTLPSEQLVDLRELKSATSVLGTEPLAQALAMRDEPGLRGARGLHTARPKARGDSTGQVFVGLALTRNPAQLASRLFVATHRHPAVAGDARYGTLLLAGPKSAQYLKNFPHRDLPVRHARPPSRSAKRDRNRSPRGWSHDGENLTTSVVSWS